MDAPLLVDLRPPAVHIVGEDVTVAVAHDVEWLLGGQADLGRLVQRREGQPGPRPWGWAGWVDPTSRQRYLPLAVDGEQENCTDRWAALFAGDRSVIAAFAPGLCVGSADGWATAVVRDGWVTVGGARLAPDAQEEADDVHRHVAPQRGVGDVEVDGAPVAEVPVGEPVVIAPAVGERRASRDVVEVGPTPATVQTSTICPIVYVQAGRAGSDGRVEVALDVETVDGGWETGDVWVEPRVPADALTLLSLRPMPIDEPLSVRVDVVDGEVEWWGLGVRGC
ncbi:MAG: hypothetical protein JJU45_07450 [Acidimicrobiia bacterium]|nr:hypothetical protein [Acidimicrobiia bacterium]